MTAPTGFNEPQGHPSAQILDDAAVLVRAEVNLLWSHARRVGGRIAVTLGLTWFAMLVTQIAVLLLALSPLIGAAYGGPILAASVAPSLLLAVVAWSLCLKKWHGLREGTNEQQKQGGTAALPLPSNEFGRR